MKEQWRDVPGYEGFYRVSNLGRVERLGRYVEGKLGSRRWQGGRILKPSDCRGYKTIMLYKHGEKKGYRVHRLVMLAFVGPVPEGGEVNHKNGEKGDNRLSNLEYTTRQGNMQHAVDNNLVAIGERAGSTSLTNDDIRLIRKLYSQNRRVKGKKYPQRKLAKMFDVGKSTIGAIVRYESWTHVD